MDSQRSGPSPATVAGLPAVSGRANGPRKDLTILFSHGVMCDHTFFERWVSWFNAAGFDAYAVSRRGRLGTPPWHSRGVTFAEFLEDTLSAARALPHPLLLVGHSLGGILSLKAAETGACEAVALMSPVPPRGILPIGRIRDLPPQLAQHGTVLTGGTFHPSLRQASAMFMGRIPRSERADLYRHYTPDSGMALRTTYLPAIPIDPGRLQVPMLCLVGLEDATIPPRSVAQIARRYGSDLICFPNHAHELVVEPGWEEVASAIAGWADRLSPGLGQGQPPGGSNSLGS